MKIVIAPDSYKESFSAIEVAQAIEKGFREIFPDAQYGSVPVADGGEGTVEAMIAPPRGPKSRLRDRAARREVDAVGGSPAMAKPRYRNGCGQSAGAGTCGKTQSTRDHFTRHGELILQALESGATNIIIGIGGSATNDGGAGMVQALGAKLCDANGNEIGFGGGSLNVSMILIFPAWIRA
ncbi:glycerate kinase [Shigella flexneri]